MPAKVSVKARPMVTAGFAKDVDEVNQYAAPMYDAPPPRGAKRRRSVRARPKISRISPAVATTSPSSRWPADRSWVDHFTSGSPNIASARTEPAIAPAI